MAAVKINRFSAHEIRTRITRLPIDSTTQRCLVISEFTALGLVFCKPFDAVLNPNGFLPPNVPPFKAFAHDLELRVLGYGNGNLLMRHLITHFILGILDITGPSAPTAKQPPQPNGPCSDRHVVHDDYRYPAAVDHRHLHHPYHKVHGGDSHQSSHSHHRAEYSQRPSTTDLTSRDLDTVLTPSRWDHSFTSRTNLVVYMRIHSTVTGESVPGAPTYTRRIRLPCEQCLHKFTHPMGRLGQTRLRENLRSDAQQPPTLSCGRRGDENGLINQLARYLEALHEPSNAEHLTKEHTALLLNSYARLDDEMRIDSFLSMLSTQPKIGNEFYPCVNVLRRAGYPRQALRLASLSGSPTDCVRILVEDLKDFPSALQEINTLPFEEALNMICAYGSLLIEALPTETAEMLDKLCSNPKAGRLNVQHFLKIFVNNRTGLMQFLERYILKPNSTKAVSSVVETLLELVLFEREAALKEGDENSPLAKRLGDLAMHLLRDSSLPYGSDKALVLCSQRKFFEGCLFLWEKNRQYNRILGHHMAQNDIEAVVSTCEKFGRDLPSLWLEALKFTADKPEASEHLTEILTHVEANNLASPLVVLKLLTSVDPSKCCKLGSVKGYLLRYLEAGRQKVETNEAEMQSLREETLRNREIVRQLKTRVKIFQQQKCAVCDQALQPPSVHFLCDHSYHEACFENYSNEDQQCPECTPRNRQLLAEAEKAATADSRSNPQLPNSPVAVCDLLEQLKTVLGSQQKPRASPGVAAPLSSAVGSLLGGGAMQAPLTGAQRRQPTVVTPAAINRPQGTKLRPAAPPVKSHPRSLADSGLGSTLPPSAPPNPFSTPLPASVRTQAPASMASPLLQLRSSRVVAAAQKDVSRVNLPVVATNPFDEDAMGEDVANNNGMSHNDTSDRDRPEKAAPMGRQEEGKEEEGDYPTHLNPFA
ncbi:Vacuolar protein sorting-associated protein 11 [Sparganum proliferum]